MFGGAIWVIALEGYSGFETSAAGLPAVQDTYTGMSHAPLLGYQVTLTNTSQVTAQITGFAVVFYDIPGAEAGSDEEGTSATLIVPGQSLTWTELSSAPTDGSNESVPGLGNDSQIPDSAASCQFAQWSS